MSWEDRDYNRGGRGTSGHGGGVDGIFAMLNLSFPIGSVLAIQVRLHITFLLLVVFETLGSHNKLGTLRWIGLLFGSVLLHEFGHVLACRRVGGQANQILLWPLGGLAYTMPPHRPWAQFWTTAWGPLVTAILAGASYAVLSARFGFEGLVSLNPMQMINPSWFSRAWGVGELTSMDRLFLELYFVNYGLFLFNLLLVFYPFDGGRLLQEVLWMFIGYARSMWWATRVGMVGAVIAAVYGVLSGQLMLLGIAVFGFMACLQQLQALKYEDDSGFSEAAYQSQSPAPRRRGWLAQWRAKRANHRSRAAAERENRSQAEVDRILDKVRDRGLQSLSNSERKILQRATERQRRAE